MSNKPTDPNGLLRYHVTGAIERGEKTAIVAVVRHTPGPWVARDATLPNSGVTRWVVLETENGFTLADTGNADTPKHQDEANARLIAAAPELLEACKGMIATWERKMGGKVTGGELFGAMLSAIAKAEGRNEG